MTNRGGGVVGVMTREVDGVNVLLLDRRLDFGIELLVDSRIYIRLAYSRKVDVIMGSLKKFLLFLARQQRKTKGGRQKKQKRHIIYLSIKMIKVVIAIGSLGFRYYFI